MDYFEATVLVAVSITSLIIMGLILYDVGKDVMHAAHKEQKKKKVRSKLPDNVVQFSRENNPRYRAIK